MSLSVTTTVVKLRVKTRLCILVTPRRDVTVGQDGCTDAESGHPCQLHDGLTVRRTLESP